MANSNQLILAPWVKMCLWLAVGLAVYILFSWLATLTFFWSESYVGETLYQTLFVYHLYRLPLWIAIGLAFLAWWKQQPVWLIGAVFLSNPYFFYFYGSIWLLSSQLAEPELIEQAPLLNEWVVLAFFSLSIITFFVYWTTRYFQTRKYLCWEKILCLIIITISTSRILIANTSITIYAPLMYYFGGSKMSFFEQTTTLMPAIPQLFLAILAVWFILEKKYHYFLLHLIAAYYYIFFTDLLMGIEHVWGETDMLAYTSLVSGISSLLFYTTTSLVFIIWFSYWLKHKINKTP